MTTAAKLAGNYGLQAYINDNTSMSVTDWLPSEESHYRSQFLFHPNGITMANGNAHYLFYALSFDGVVVARIEFGYATSTGYQIRAGARKDDGTYTTLSWATGISNASHKIELDWQAASAPGANNGILTLWIDGVQKGTVANLDNDGMRINAGQLGPVSGIDTGTRGTEYFDGFVSRRNSYIGLVQPGGPQLAEGSPDQSSLVQVSYQPAASFRLVGDGMGLPQQAPYLDPFQPRQTISYTYDPLNRLTAADYSNGSYFHYSYDAVGNRVSETTLIGRTCYYYDIANRLTQVYATSNTQPCPETPTGTAYTWDNNGNLLSDGQSTYSYDHANRLVSVIQGTNTTTFTYNGLGDRVSETINGVTTNFTLDLAGGLTQVLADGADTYLYGNERIGQFTALDTAYFLGDALGSMRQLLDEDGAVTLAKAYEPYGEVASSTGTGYSEFGFTGEQQDSNSSLLFLRSRFYMDGRFLTKDSWKGDVRLPLSLNSWLYVLGNPINYTDRTGRDVDCEPLWSYACWNEKAGFELKADRYSDPWTGPKQDRITSAYSQAAYLKYLEVSAIKCYVSTMDVLAATSHAEYGNLKGELLQLSLEGLGRQFYHACGSKGECKGMQLWVFLGAQQGWYGNSAPDLITYMQIPKARLSAEIIRDTKIWRTGQVWNRPWVTGNLSLYKEKTRGLILNAGQGVKEINYFRLDKSQPDPFLIFTPGQATHWHAEDSK